MWKDRHSLGAFLCILVIVLAGFMYIFKIWNMDLVSLWFFALAGLLGFLIVVGLGVTGRWAGILVDSRNRFSLARLQLVLWTILILSAYATAVSSNLRIALTSMPINSTEVVHAVSIAMPEQVWLLMGISTTSIVGSSLILSTKKDQSTVSAGGSQQSVDKQITRTVNNLISQNKIAANTTTQDFKANQVQGQLVINETPNKASYSEMLKGDFINNAFQLDLGKIQMFYFTMILVLVYAAALISLFLAGGKILQFPIIDSGMAVLLGISHAGYLAKKDISGVPGT
ncbi:Uncharacterised protein [uncultured archaeon]|nr:Uncharacterised protein [uncultured archaeon]